MLSKVSLNPQDTYNYNLIWLLKENLIQSLYDYSSWISFKQWQTYKLRLKLLSPEEIVAEIQEMVNAWFGNINIPIKRKEIEKCLEEFISCYEIIKRESKTSNTNISINENLLSIILHVRWVQMSRLQKAAA